MMETPMQVVVTVLKASDKLCLKVTQCLGPTDSTTATLDLDHLHHVMRLIRDTRAALYEIFHRLCIAGDSEFVNTKESFNLCHVRRYQQLLGGIEASLDSGPLDGSKGQAQAATYTDTLRRDLAQVLAQVVSALISGSLFAVLRALSQPDQPDIFMGAYEQQLVLTTLRWLRELRPDELTSQQLCDGIAVSVAREAKSLADVPALPEAELIRLCGGLVRRTADGSGIEVACCPRDQELWHSPTTDARYEIGITCLRILNFEEFGRAPGEYRVEEALAERRDAEHPFYRYAAATLMEEPPVIESDEAFGQEFTDEACRLFSFRGNLICWLLEMGRQSLVTTYPLSPAQIFICLTTMCVKHRLTPMHIAACFGLSDVCRALVERGFDVNTISDRAGTALYCALAGPALLLSDTLDIKWEVVRKHFCQDSRLDTADTLLELGAARDGVPSISHKCPSFAAVVLMACTARSAHGDITFMTSLLPAGSWADEDFLATFQDPDFPFRPSDSASSDGRSMQHPQRKFLDDLCNILLDRSWASNWKVWFAAWKKGAEHNLECTWPTTRRRVPLDDKNFAQGMMKSMKSKMEPSIRYMMQDSRWDANVPLEDAAEEDRGRTLLHRAVEEGDTSLVELLLQHGRADVSVSDASGRTPLHLCGSSDILRLLVSSGADLRQTDKDGRLLWHYAAANNDIDLLRTLIALDSDKEWVLRQTTKQGRTPLAEALAYVRELNGLAPVSRGRYASFLAEQTQSIWFILEWFILDRIRNDAAYLASDIPVLCLAAEWGIEDMVWTLRQNFSRLDLVTAEGSGPLHFLNFSASSKLIRQILGIPGVAELPVLNRHGYSPAETIFFAFKPESDERNDNAHPSNNSELDRSAYMMLLTEEVRKSRDERGRPLWERFCRNVILHYAQKPQWLRIGNAISTAVSCFVAKGVIQEYESATDSCALVELSRLLWHETRLEGIPLWLSGVCEQLFRATTNLQRLKDEPELFLLAQSTTENGCDGVPGRLELS
jgi:hypothetical protein